MIKIHCIGAPRGEECGRGSCSLGNYAFLRLVHPLLCFGASKMRKESLAGVTRVVEHHPGLKRLQV